MQQAWRGNVRELQNAIERMRLMNSDKLSYDLPDANFASEGSEGTVPASAAEPAPTTGPAEPSSTDPADDGSRGEDERAFLRMGHAPFRRRERLRELFRQHHQLARPEVMQLLRISPQTATRDLKALAAEGLIEKVEPSGSPRTHYFRLRG
jgi:DNA-binding NtrC family response regulator